MIKKNVMTLNDSRIISKLKFTYPQQVLFHLDFDEDNEFNSGLAYGKEVICMCCGAVNSLDDIDFLQYDPQIWCNVDDELMEGLQKEFYNEE